MGNNIFLKNGYEFSLYLLGHHSFTFDIYVFTFKRSSVLLDIKEESKAWMHTYSETEIDIYLFKHITFQKMEIYDPWST